MRRFLYHVCTRHLLTSCRRTGEINANSWLFGCYVERKNNGGAKGDAEPGANGEDDDRQPVDDEDDSEYYSDDEDGKKNLNIEEVDKAKRRDIGARPWLVSTLPVVSFCMF